MLKKFVKELKKNKDYDLSEISLEDNHDCVVYSLDDQEVNLFKTLKRLNPEDLEVERKLAIRFLNLWRGLFWVHVARVLGVSTSFPLKVVRDDSSNLVVALKNPKNDAVKHIFLHSNLRSIPLFPYLLDDLIGEVTLKNIDNNEPDIPPREGEEKFGELSDYLKKLFVVWKGFLDHKKEAESYFSKRLFRLEIEERYPGIIDKFRGDSSFEVIIRKGWKVVARKLNTFFIDFNASANC